MAAWQRAPGRHARSAARQTSGPPRTPVLVQVPIGCWLSASVLDFVPGAHHAATTLTAVGLAGVAPAAVAGWAVWADTWPTGRPSERTPQREGPYAPRQYPLMRPDPS